MHRRREAQGAQRLNQDLGREILGVSPVADAPEHQLVDAQHVVPVHRLPIRIAGALDDAEGARGTRFWVHVPRNYATLLQQPV